MGNLIFRVVILIFFLFEVVQNIHSFWAVLWGLVTAVWAYDTYRRAVRRSSHHS